MSLYIPPKLTYQDLLDFPEDGKRYEIIGGELFVAASRSVKHQRLLARFYRSLYDTLEDSGWGEIFLAPLHVKFSEYDVVEPDLIAIRAGHREIMESNHLTAAPDIVLEVISPFSRRYDEVTKLALYARFGVPQFWLADSVNLGLRGLTLRNGSYFEIVPDADGLLRSIVVPDLVFDPVKLFANLSD